VLLREDGDAVVCIGQLAHSWLSGQLARAWARDPVEPREEVCLAAQQHDIGMADWDAAPELNPDTGRPYSFMEMPVQTHMRLWTQAPHRMRPQSRFAAVLVSMHGTALYEMRNLDRMSDDEAAAVRGYLRDQRALQERWSEGLDREALRRGQRLVWILDFLSLGLCLRWERRSVEGVTLREGTIEPWPFRDDDVTVRTEGRRLEGRFDDEDEMRAALDAAPWVELRFELTAGGRARSP
jgi:Protein of unknown function (DUF3891)